MPLLVEEVRGKERLEKYVNLGNGMLRASANRIMQLQRDACKTL